MDPMASLINFNHKAFKVVLNNPGGGAALGTRCECRVILVPGGSRREAEGGKLALKGGHSSGLSEDDGGGGGEEKSFWMEWRCRFKEAIIPDLEVEGEDDSLFLTCFLHYISITWNLMAALIPPPEFGGGYVAFFGSLVLLTGLMAVVKEAAGLFGCVVGLNEIMVGISIVAIGTSLPDTFASRMATLQDDNADAAIGNVMASNAVNIFLGLGIPWIIGSVYRTSNNDVYAVSGGALGFSLIVFFILAGLAVMFLLVRRSQGGELGGGKVGQRVSFGFFSSLWIIFLIIVGLYAYLHIPQTDQF